MRVKPRVSLRNVFALKRNLSFPRRSRRVSCLVCRVAFIAAGLSTSFPCNGFCFSAVWQRNVISSNARFIAFLEDLQADATGDKHTFTTAFNSTSRPVLRPQNEFMWLGGGGGWWLWLGLFPSCLFPFIFLWPLLVVLNTRYEVLTAVLLRILVSSHVTLCRCVSGNLVPSPSSSQSKKRQQDVTPSSVSYIWQDSGEIGFPCLHSRIATSFFTLKTEAVGCSETVVSANYVAHSVRLQSVASSALRVVRTSKSL